MKTLHKITETTQFPDFWDEEWLKKAIQEVDLRAMSAEQKLAYEMAISANALAIKNENRKIQAMKEKIVKNLLSQNKFTFEEIAELVETDIDFVMMVNNRRV